ncbi:hypothetical protein [Halobellus salinisoli]|uniref:hypothetical protein n=1 Tax=Halobellus salinisoli TaxID=3108500 RepID=UPI003008EB27
MQGHLAPIDGDSDTVRRVVLEEPVGVFRSESDILAATSNGDFELGVRDMTVSRRANGKAPITFVPHDDAIEVTNQHNSNAVRIDTGVLKRDLQTGESERLTQDATVKVGYNTTFRVTVEREHSGKTLSKTELEELGLTNENSESLMEGVSPASYVQSVADNLRKSRQESPNECLKYASELQTFTAEHPLDSDAYATFKDDLNAIVDRLDQKVSQSALRGTDLDDQWNDELGLIAHRAERLYSQS